MKNLLICLTVLTVLVSSKTLNMEETFSYGANVFVDNPPISDDEDLKWNIFIDNP